MSGRRWPQLWPRGTALLSPSFQPLNKCPHLELHGWLTGIAPVAESYSSPLISSRSWFKHNSHLLENPQYNSPIHHCHAFPTFASCISWTMVRWAFRISRVTCGPRNML
nr:hypothetical protein Iba_chr09dCG14030 [Ipomoea batatas]